MDFQSSVDRDSDHDLSCPAPSNTPAVDPNAKNASDRLFVSLRNDSFKEVRTRARTVLTMPWGPRIDVIFDPKGAAHMLGGKVTLAARTAGTEIEITSAFVTNVEKPLSLSGALACDEYVVYASAATEPSPQLRRIECYAFARVYALST